MDTELQVYVEDDEFVPTADNYTPTFAEKKLLRAIFDPANVDATVSAICKAANVSRETYYKAIKRPEFANSIIQVARDATKGKAAKYVQLLEKFAAEGSYAHLRPLLAMSGLYDEKMTIEVDPVKAVLRPRAPEQG